jgi:hypothetical protein
MRFGPRHADADPWKHRTEAAVNDLHHSIVVMGRACAVAPAIVERHVAIMSVS